MLASCDGHFIHEENPALQIAPGALAPPRQSDHAQRIRLRQDVKHIQDARRRRGEHGQHGASGLHLGEIVGRLALQESYPVITADAQVSAGEGMR